MKHFFFAFSLILSGLTFAQVTETATPAPKEGLKFTTLEIVRENIPYDNKDLFEFEFKNVSKQDATIQNVQTSCGCTAAQKPTAPIPAGKKDKISVSYDTKRVGPFTKTITITSDVSDPVVLTIKGTVLPQPEVPMVVAPEPVKN
jgi:hypothetical protein